MSSNNTLKEDGNVQVKHSNDTNEIELGPQNQSAISAVFDDIDNATAAKGML